MMMISAHHSSSPPLKVDLVGSCESVGREVMVAIGVKAFHVVTYHHDHHITTSSEVQHRIIDLERKRQLTPLTTNKPTLRVFKGSPKLEQTTN